MVAGENGRADEVRDLITRHREPLRSETWPWGAAGAGLFEIGDYKACAEWMVDYASRPEVEAWMLLNLALALRHLRRESESREVSRAALDLEHDGATVAHSVWLSFDAELSRSEAPPPDVDPQRAGTYYQFLHHLTLALRAARSGPSHFAEAREQVHAARKAQPFWWKDSLLRRALEDTVAEIEQAVGTPWARLWGLHRFWHVNWP
jgi:hypothetical protein